MKKREVIISLLSDEEFNDIIQEFKKESDRAAVILSAAKIDAQLYLLLSKYLIPTSNSQDELLDGDSPLGTFSAKINMAYRLGLIDAHYAKSLHLIRKIRNSFAHEFKGMSLTTGGHADRVRELVVYFKDYEEYHDLKEEYFGTQGGLDIDFRMIVTIAILRLDTATHYAPNISGDPTQLVPVMWNKILRAKDQITPVKKSTPIKKKALTKKAPPKKSLAKKQN